MNKIVAKPVFDTMEIGKLKASVEKIGDQAKSIVIKGAEDYTAAVQLTKATKIASNQITKFFKPAKDEANAVVKEIREEEKKLLSPLQSAESDIKTKILDYQRAEQERQRAEQEIIAERKRKEAEKLMEMAIEAESDGNAIESAILQEQAVEVELTPVVTQDFVPTVAGASVRKTWTAEIEDESKIPIEINGMMIRPVDTKLLNSLASSTKGTMKIPGVRFYQKETLAIRTT
jgi:uncharacterized protein with gpF-like domain